MSQFSLSHSLGYLTVGWREVAPYIKCILKDDELYHQKQTGRWVDAVTACSPRPGGWSDTAKSDTPVTRWRPHSGGPSPPNPDLRLSAPSGTQGLPGPHPLSNILIGDLYPLPANTGRGPKATSNHVGAWENCHLGNGPWILPSGWRQVGICQPDGKVICGCPRGGRRLRAVLGGRGSFKSLPSMHYSLSRYTTIYPLN